MVSDAVLMARRNLRHTFREPQLLVFSTIQPVIFVLLFRYVFGGAISTGTAYVDYLMPGIFVQTTVFGSMLTGLGLAYDMDSGILDRFKSLPMSRSAVLVGRTLTDMLRNLFVVFLMLVVGLLVGFHIHGGIGGLLGGVGLILAFGFAFSWISALLGIAIRNPEAVQSAGFIWVFPLTFVSSAFVRVQTMPTWLQGFANLNPFTITVNAARQLFLGPEASQVPGLGTNTAPNAWGSIAWIIGLLIVFVPLAVQRYRKAT
jgi:ABC-2 type transport system permease protein/oleandomycin transport system permease protein